MNEEANKAIERIDACGVMLGADAKVLEAEGVPIIDALAYTHGSDADHIRLGISKGFITDEKVHVALAAIRKVQGGEE